MKKRTSNSYWGLILILGSMSAIGPLSIDLYLPAFNDIARDLNTDLPHVAYTLSSYFLGIGIGQLIFGPITDRFGRKWPTVIGLFVFGITAAFIYLTPTIEAFIGARIIMALGGCIGMITSKAMVRDLFPPDKSAQVFSVLMLVMGIAPVVGPTLGGVMVAQYGWRSIFVFLTLYATLVFLAVLLLLKETRGPDKNVSLGLLSILREYKAVLSNAWFIKFSISGSLAYAGMFAYISGASFIYLDVFGLSQQQFGWTFGLNAGGYILGAQLNGIFLRKWSSVKVCQRTMMIQFVIAIVMVVICWRTGWLFWGASIGIWFYLFCLGFITPNTTAQALVPFQSKAGMASAMIGSMQMVSGALISLLVSSLIGTTILPILCVMLGASCIGMLVLNGEKILALSRS
ncbi:multidrug effflux MFS transporter [Membranihabitans marinus]|uniref:multidrug effflux MFS transporter n=1 Tax=Membranihabitans marinus TaxID=1227546 RepID=UPI001F19160A|nr:multidrug effflux MFS transporter [Membranihabitans marinus]